MQVSLSVVVTFHSEGLFAHATLSSYLRARRAAKASGYKVEFILVMDRTDQKTTEIVCGHPELEGDEIILTSSCGDPGLSRNHAVAHATGTHVCTLDGDDLIGREYFLRHLACAVGTGKKVILHPEVVVCFGKDRRFNFQIDQRSRDFSADMLLQVNPWISAACAASETFFDIPYQACHPAVTGFGYEDWHWNCQTVAAGYEHWIVPGTVYFYRLKEIGSVNSTSNSLNVLMPPSGLFGSFGVKK